MYAEGVGRGLGAAASRESAAPELQLLLCCARDRFGAADPDEIRAALELPIDWRRLAWVASWHKMIPLVYARLTRLTELRENAGMAALRRLSLENAGQALQLTRELLEILRLLEKEGVPAVPYKGPVLADRLYGSIAMRQMTDLDVLIRKRDMLTARAALAAHGYHPVYDLTGATRKFKLTHGYCEDFRGPTGTALELHWAFTNGDVHFPLVLEDLLPRLEEIRVAGMPVRSFPREDLLPILCVHGARHRWERLEWLCGVAELLRTRESLDWDHILARAEELGTTRTLLVGILLAHELLGVECPAGVPGKLFRKSQIVALTTELRDRLLLEHVDEPEGWRAALRRDLFMLKLRDSASDRLRYLWHRGARRVARVQRRESPEPLHAAA